MEERTRKKMITRVYSDGSAERLEDDMLLEENATVRGASQMAVEWKMSFEAIMSGIDWIAEAPLFLKTGCVHVAALIRPDGEKLFRVEDIGRHNAVDKAVEWLRKSGIAPKDVAIITSGRQPADMVQKSLDAGIPLMASISAATVQGMEAAQSGNMTLIGFARGNRMNVYSAPERVICRVL